MDNLGRNLYKVINHEAKSANKPDEEKSVDIRNMYLKDYVKETVFTSALRYVVLTNLAKL